MTASSERSVATRKAIASGCPEERRQIRRSKIFVPVTLMTPQCEVRAHLLDIGTGGALCFSETQPKHDSIVDICWHASSWAARVIWVNDRRFGLRFLSPLGLDAVQAVIENRA